MIIKNPKIVLNNNQKKAVEHEKGPLLIIAGAGTGKTTVITEKIKWLVSQEVVRVEEILALTFTEKAAHEMEERVDVAMPFGYTQMWISTFHSFCDRILRDEGLNIGIDTGYKLMSDADSTKLIRDNLFKFKLKYFRPLGNPTKFITSSLVHFSRLQDEDIKPSEYILWAKTQKSRLRQGYGGQAKIKNQKDKEEKLIISEKYIELAEFYRDYSNLKLKKGLMDFADLISNTLRLFRERQDVLKEYQKRFKYILVDEFQDTNMAQYELIKMLAPNSNTPNLTVVGDDNQCLPKDTKITTINGQREIKDIRSGDKVITAVGKGHTSISKVTRVFKQTKKVRIIAFKTEDGRRIRVTDNHKMFGFMPASYKFQGWYFVYLMYQEILGWRLGITKNPPVRLRLEAHADKIIVIGSYKTEQEARYYESYFSAYYGIPTVPFSARPLQSISGLWLTRLFKDINTNKNVLKLAADLHIELDSPHVVRGAVTRGISKRIKVNLQMCYRNYRSKTHKKGYVGNPSISHLVYLETSNLKIINKLNSFGFHIEKAKKVKRLRFTTTDLSDAWETALKLVEITGGMLDKKFSVGLYKYQHLPARIMPASHIFPGMYLPVLKGKKIVYKLITERKVTEKTEEIYDLEIEKTHNFIASGIVVHNSIYKFRGAAVSNILSFKKDYKDSDTVVLNDNYRSTQEILDKSYKLIKFNDPDTLEATLGISKKLKSTRNISGEKVELIYTNTVEDEAEEVVQKIILIQKKHQYRWSDFAVLFRANSHSEPFIKTFNRLGVPYQFLGPGMLFKQPEIKNLIAYLKVLNNIEDSTSFYKVLAWDLFELTGRELTMICIFAKKYSLSIFEACEILTGRQILEFPNIKIIPSLNTETKVKFTEIVKMIHRHLSLVPKETAGQILFYFFEDTGLINKFTSYTSEKEEKEAQNIASFFNKLKNYEAVNEDASISAVVDWIDLSLDLGESPILTSSDWTENNAVNLLTAHSSKGLEFSVVFLVNLVSQRFPTIERKEKIPIPEELIKESLPIGNPHIEEERRLFYVGMTRAADKLFLTAASYYHEGKREKKISPFVVEVLGATGIVRKEKEEKNQLSLFDWKSQPIKQIPATRSLINFLSYSSIQTFKQCPLHFKLKYILRIPTAATPALSFGNTIHMVMRDFYQSVKSGNPISFNILKDMLKKNWVSEGYKNREHEKQNFKKGLEYLSGYLNKTFNAKVVPQALEVPFIFPLSNNLKFGGKIDRVDVLNDGKIEIIDYKTGANVPDQKKVDKDMQLTFYSLAATEIKNELFWKKPEEVIVSLYYFDKQIKISSTRNREQLNEAKTLLLEIAQQINQSEFECVKGEYCRNCEFNLYCH